MSPQQTAVKGHRHWLKVFRLAFIAQQLNIADLLLKQFLRFLQVLCTTRFGYRLRTPHTRIRVFVDRRRGDNT